MTIKLNGIGALVAIIAVLGFGAFRYSAMQNSLSDQGAEALRLWLGSEILRHHQALDEHYSVEERVAYSEAASNIEFVALSAIGTGKKVAVKAVLKPNPYLPPGRGLTRYFQMRYSTITGWSYEREISKLSYYMSWI